MFIKKLFYIFIVAFSFMLSLSCSNKKDDPITDEILNPKYSDYIQQAQSYLEESKFQGSVLVGKKGQIIYAEGFGSSDPKNSRAEKNTIHTTYEIGSVTKQMTAAAIMQLIEKDKLSLNCTLSEFFPEYAHGEITIEMLLNMRSGLTDYINSGDDFFPRKVYNQLERSQLANKPVDESIVLKYFYDAPLLAKPNSTYFYCNTNYYLLACILEQITNQTYKDYMLENIMKPCKMVSTNLDFQNTTSKGYDFKGRYYSIPQALSKGCGDVNSNVLDVFKWNCSFYEGNIVSKKSFRRMTNSNSYGYGIYCSPDSYFHGGNTNVFNAYNVYYPKEKVSIIVLSNNPSTKLSATIIGRNLYKIYKNSNK